MSDGNARAGEGARQAEVRKLMAQLAPEITKKLLLAAGPEPRTGSAALKKLVEDALSKLTEDFVVAAGPEPRTG